ncbi:MAG TPA: DUF3810 domain-containing protein [Acetivibrio sp.]|nr:DUF3810 domain-containing protein [Clostridium sp.]HOQ38210.1 DUF3810 domain-containing protein [Acetivibrio sp.]HPT91570.1 DUF3810 domain-containing protein [Acetivibrio sp.]
MKKKAIHKRLLLVLLIPLGYLLFYLSSLSHSLTEKIYSQVLYKVLTLPLNLLFGYIPISMAEILLISTVLILLFLIVRTIIRIIKSSSEKWSILGRAISNFVAALSILYFSFILLWGFNYQRLPFKDIAGYDTQPTDINMLKQVCEALIQRTNELRTQVDENSNGIMKLSGGINNTLKRAHLGYKNIESQYPELTYKFGRPKGVLLSEVMSYLGIGGVYFPYTTEANVNISLPSTSLPFTACHEIAHQIGFSREDEANYIAYLACKYHPDADFQYSGTLSAMIYATNALYQYSPEDYFELREKYSEGVNRDVNALNNYWEKYETKIQDFSSSINNAYLKANMQNDGVRSYGRMVDLLIAEYRKK